MPPSAPGGSQVVELGRIIRARRRELNRSLGDVADSLGVSFDDLQRFERGLANIPASILSQIAIELGLEPSDVSASGKPAVTAVGAVSDVVQIADARKSRDIRPDN